jgi:hypothetical protein
MNGARLEHPVTHIGGTQIGKVSAGQSDALPLA